jgi:hypothetical protein
MHPSAQGQPLSRRPASPTPTWATNASGPPKYGEPGPAVPRSEAPSSLLTHKLDSLTLAKSDYERQLPENSSSARGAPPGHVSQRGGPYPSAPASMRSNYSGALTVNTERRKAEARALTSFFVRPSFGEFGKPISVRSNYYQVRATGHRAKMI